MHFEDIWNDAEQTAKQENKTVSNYLDELKLVLDKFPREVKLDKSEQLREASLLIGEMIFQICGITMLVNTNSAAALKEINNAKKQNMLDPD